MVPAASRQHERNAGAHTLAERLPAADLAPSEREVARFFAERGDEAVFLSAADIAGRLGVSNATVVRTAQALGYAGLPELKRELQATLRGRATPVERLDRRLDELGDDPTDLLSHLISAQIEILEDARRSVRPEDFKDALAILARAERIVVYGVGPHGSLAEYFTRSVRRLGRSVLALTGRGHDAVDQAMELRKGDVLLAILFERTFSEAEVLLEHARARHVPCVLLTDNLALALEGRFDVALPAQRGSSAAFPLSAIVVVLLEALLLGLAGGDRGRSVAALEELNALREKLGGA